MTFYSHAQDARALNLEQALCAAVAFTAVRKDSLATPNSFAMLGGVAAAAILKRWKFSVHDARPRSPYAEELEEVLWERYTKMSWLGFWRKRRRIELTKSINQHDVDVDVKLQDLQTIQTLYTSLQNAMLALFLSFPEGSR